MKISTLKKTLFLAICALITLTTTACFGGKSEQRTYYAIDYPIPHPEVGKPKLTQKTILVDRITSLLAYDKQQIVYRINPYEFQYYWYKLWATRPRKMLHGTIASHLRSERIFTRVNTAIEDYLPDYKLDTHIAAIEELDVSKEEWLAHLALTFTLTRTSDQQIIWTYSFDRKEPVTSNDPVYVVKALSVIMQDELTKAFDDMRLKLAAEIPAEELNQAHLKEFDEKRNSMHIKRVVTPKEPTKLAAEPKSPAQNTPKTQGKAHSTLINKPR